MYCGDHLSKIWESEAAIRRVPLLGNARKMFSLDLQKTPRYMYEDNEVRPEETPTTSHRRRGGNHKKTGNILV